MNLSFRAVTPPELGPFTSRDQAHPTAAWDRIPKYTRQPLPCPTPWASRPWAYGKSSNRVVAKIRHVGLPGIAIRERDDSILRSVNLREIGSDALRNQPTDCTLLTILKVVPFMLSDISMKGPPGSNPCV